MALPKFAFFNGEIVPYENAKVSVLTHGLNYGTAVFGGLRGYWDAEQQELFLFRPFDHYRRFLNSSKLLLMKFDETPESLVQKTIQLLHKENYQCDVYIRPLAYKADEIIGVKLHGLKDEFSIVAMPSGKYIVNDTSAHVTISSWRRVDDNMIPARGKVSGAYVNSALAKTDAVQAGFDEALVMNQDGHLSEGSAMNIFMIRGGVVVTPPITDNILEGITRKAVIELICNEIGMPFVERPIDRTEVYLCEEFFMTGTAAEVVAVTRVDYRPIGNGVMGPVTARLRELFEAAVRCRLPTYCSWNVPVYQKS
jgi:branched-chain amino acid aminotransferase